jgi:hypothetical protein
MNLLLFDLSLWAFARLFGGKSMSCWAPLLFPADQGDAFC